MKAEPTLGKATTEPAQPWPILVGLWVSAALLSLLFSSEVSGWIFQHEWLSTQTWALKLAQAISQTSEVTRIRSARGRMEALVGTAGAWLVVSARAEHRTESQETKVLVSDVAVAHRILLIGESSIQFYLGSELERALVSSYRDVEVKRFGKLGTSLVRTDVFDWEARTSALLDEFNPDLVIANFGGNDAQNIVAEDGTLLKFGTSPWDNEFARRVSAITHLVRKRGARLAMIGMPAMRDPWFSRRMKHVNKIIQEQMERLGEAYLSCWELSVDSEGEYKKTVTMNGTTGLMRLSDGKHYSKPGARFVAEQLLEKLERQAVLWPSDDALSVTVTFHLTSRALGQPASYLAYVPHGALKGRARFPVLFLLHGSRGSFKDWSDHAHRKLQRLSTAHGLIIVTPEGGYGGWYLDSPLVSNSQYETHLIEEVVPDVDRRLPTSGVRGSTGLSAGGNGAIALALKYPKLFRSASSMSGAIDLSQAANRPALIERLGAYSSKNQQIWHGNSARHLAAKRPDLARRLPMLITVGSSDRWAPANRAFAAELATLGAPHVFQESEGEHDWSYWTEQLPKHVEWQAAKLTVP